MTARSDDSHVDSPPAVHLLANGLRVVVEEDHLAPAVAVNLWYGVGSRHETVGRTGLAHLFEHLMFQGSANVEPGGHFAAMDEWGASLNASTSFDRTNYFETVPSEGLDLALWLEADRMGGLLEALDQRSLDAQREVVRNERRERLDNQPYGTAIERMLAATFPVGHQYHHMPIGSMEDLRAASLEDTQTFFRTHYHPGNAVLSIVGDVTVATAMESVHRYFDGIPAAAPAPIRTPQPLPSATTQTRLHVDDEEVPASAAYLMWRVPADGVDGCDEVDLATRVLGGTMSSRLHTDLVRNHELAQRAWAGVMRLVGGHSVAIVDMLGADGVDPEALVDAAFDQLADLTRGGPDADELGAARARAEAEYLADTETLGGRADSLSHGLSLFADPGYDAATSAGLQQISTEAVQAASGAWLSPETATVLTYRPRPSGQAGKEIA